MFLNNPKIRWLKALRIPFIMPAIKTGKTGGIKQYFYSFDVLQRARNAIPPKIQCQISFEMVNASSLIDDITNVAKDKESKTMTLTRNQVFISYSHQDEGYLKQLQTYLKPLERTLKKSRSRRRINFGNYSRPVSGKFSAFTTRTIPNSQLTKQPIKQHG